MAGLSRGGIGVAVVAAAAALLLSGCDVRWETEPPTFPSPDAVTVARDSLADAENAVLQAASREGVGVYATAAQAHLDVLGGVYVAYPGTTPTPSPSPTPEPTLDEAVAAARATAEDVAATTSDADLAAIARSIDLEWALRGLWAAREATLAEAGAAPSASPDAEPSAGEDSPADADPVWFPRADGTTADDAGMVPTETTGVSQEALSELAVAEDEARFAYETLAAQEFAQDRDAALARAALHAERSDALAALLTDDPRTPLYQLRDVDLLDPEVRAALQLSLETDLAVRYTTLLDGASDTDAAWLLNASFDAYARAMRTEGFAESDLPTLPGLRVSAS